MTGEYGFDYAADGDLVDKSEVGSEALRFRSAMKSAMHPFPDQVSKTLRRGNGYATELGSEWTRFDIYQAHAPMRAQNDFPEGMGRAQGRKRGKHAGQ